MADLTIYMVRQHHTLKRLLELINESYISGLIKNIGIVVNDIRESKIAGYYGYNYGYVYFYSFGYGYYDEGNK